METSLGSGIGAGVLLLLAGLGVVVLVAWAGSVAWVWRDAERRGQPGFIVAVLVALLFWPLSVVVWVAARPNTPETAAAKGSRGWIWALIVVIGIMLVAVVLPIVLAIAVPFASHARESAYRVECASHQQQIALAYLMYAEDHNGACPKTFDDLRKYGLTDSRLLYCPSAQDKTRPSYELVCGTNATDLIVREVPGNHRGYSVAAYRDGHVEAALSKGGNP